MSMMIKSVLLFSILVTFTACIQKTSPVSDRGRETNRVDYIVISDSTRARPILDPSYDEIIVFMHEHKMDVNTHFIIEHKVQLTEDYGKILISIAGVDDFPDILKKDFTLKEGFSNSSGIFVIDVETDQVLEYQEKKVKV